MQRNNDEDFSDIQLIKCAAACNFNICCCCTALFLFSIKLEYDEQSGSHYFVMYTTFFFFFFICTLYDSIYEYIGTQYLA